MKRINLVCLAIICLLLVACGGGSKNVSTLEKFKEITLNNDFSVNDNLNYYQNYNYITGSYVAANENYTIEMVTYKDKDSAKKSFENITNKFKEMRGSGATPKTSKGDNYETYKMVSNNYYMLATRVENTIIFTKAPLTYKDTVDKVFNDMGY